MFGHCNPRRKAREMGRRAASRPPFRPPRHGRRRPPWHGLDDMMRAGRMLAQGDLRLVALAFIAEQPRHGYEIIKLVEEKTADWYSPSPGIIYPTLTYLEEAGYVTASTEGARNSTPSPTKAAPISMPIATWSTRFCNGSPRSASASATGAAPPAANVARTTAAGCRHCSKPPSTTCATPQPNGSKATRTPSRAWSKSSPARRPICGGRERGGALTPVEATRPSRPSPRSAHVRSRMK